MLAGIGSMACGSSPASEAIQAGPLAVAVSILPQKYFVDRIGGPAVAVSVLIGPGQSPDTYDPTPRQMASLAGTQIYFTMGLEFEHAWLRRMHSAYPGMTLIDMRQGIELLPLDEDADPRHEGRQDPHVWMSPRLVAVMAGTIRDALIEALPDRRELFDLNYERFVRDLNAIDGEVRGLLHDLPTRTFMAFHPAWAYFAEDYRLHQVPIASHGKEPGARTLARLIDQARGEHIGVVLVQAQYSQDMAKTVAEAAGARVLMLDPLSEDYVNNVRHVAKQLAEALRES